MPSKASSSVDTLKKPLSLARLLIQNKSTTCTPRNVAVTTSENQPTIIDNMSRSLQDIRDLDQFLDTHHQSYPCCKSDLNVSASYLSSLNKSHDHSAQVLLYINAAVTTTDSHDVTARSSTEVADDYDYIYFDLTSLKPYTNTTGS